MKFSDIPGHDDVKSRLRELVDTGRVPHALLLEGPEGTAKFALARAFVQYLHCRNRTSDGDSCGHCPACVQHETFNHIDTFFSFPVVKRVSGKPAVSDDYLPEFRSYIQEHPYMDFEPWLEALDNPKTPPRIFVDEGAELLRKLNFQARTADYKAVLMWLPENMNVETANKLLKLIEEPHPDTVFVLTSDRPEEILPTIYSRTQRIVVRRYPEETVESFLVQRGVAGESATELARLAEGNLNTAIRLSADADGSATMLDAFADLMRKGFKRDLPGLRKWADTMAAKDRKRAIQFVDYCARIFRENLLLHTSAGAYLTSLTPAEAKFSERFHPYVNERNVIGLFNAMNDAHRDIAANGNAKIIFFDLAIRVVMLIRK